MMLASASIDWLGLFMGLAGGLTLFLLGMAQITAALKALAGDRLRTACVPPKILHRGGAAATFPPKPRTAQGRHKWPLSGSERVVGVIINR